MGCLDFYVMVSSKMFGFILDLFYTGCKATLCCAQIFESIFYVSTFLSVEHFTPIIVIMDKKKVFFIALFPKLIIL